MVRTVWPEQASAIGVGRGCMLHAALASMSLNFGRDVGVIYPGTAFPEPCRWIYTQAGQLLPSGLGAAW